MTIFKVSEKVIFDKQNGKSECNHRGLLVDFGVIVKVNEDNTYHIMYFDDYKICLAHNIELRYILPISQVQFERDNIVSKYENLINIEKSKLRTVSQEEKDKEKLERYENIKQRIIRNCEWCINKDLDDEDFINRVKEIANLKKQLFCPERLPCMSEIHKHNGTIKYNIRKLESERNGLLNRLSDEEIMKRLKDF